MIYELDYILGLPTINIQSGYSAAEISGVATTHVCADDARHRAHDLEGPQRISSWAP